MPVIVATAGDDDISAIFTSTSSQDVPAEERAQLLGLLPPLICSVCAAGTASSTTRYPYTLVVPCTLFHVAYLTALQFDLGMRPVAAFFLQFRAIYICFARSAAAQRHLCLGIFPQPFLHVRVRAERHYMPAHRQTLSK